MKNLISARPLAYALLVAMPLWFGSCKKNGNESVTPVVTTASIEGNWKITTMKLNPAVDFGFGKIDDLIAFLKAIDAGAGACLNDVTVTFNKNGTTTQNNPASCKSSEEVTEVIGSNNGGKWKQDGNKLTLTETDGTTSTFDIVLDANTMQWSQITELEDQNGKPLKTTVTIGFKRA